MTSSSLTAWCAAASTVAGMRLTGTSASGWSWPCPSSISPRIRWQWNMSRCENSFGSTPYSRHDPTPSATPKKWYGFAAASARPPSPPSPPPSSGPSRTSFAVKYASSLSSGSTEYSATLTLRRPVSSRPSAVLKGCGSSATPADTCSSARSFSLGRAVPRSSGSAMLVRSDTRPVRPTMLSRNAFLPPRSRASRPNSAMSRSVTMPSTTRPSRRMGTARRPSRPITRRVRYTASSGREYTTWEMAVMCSPAVPSSGSAPPSDPSPLPSPPIPSRTARRMSVPVSIPRTLPPAPNTMNASCPWSTISARHRRNDQSAPRAGSGDPASSSLRRRT
mmetsp:Transcript_40067/g.78276  ORF Transcript_40067/g.78276 Transcript_40067/m.78276 type:complete len:334 (+) Transcript_40067:905-1906(+)